MGLASPWWPEEDDVLFRLDEVEGAEVGDDVPADRALVVVVEVLEGLAGRQPGGPDPGLAAMALAGRDLALETGREILLVALGVSPGPLGQPGGGVEERRCLQGPAEVGEVGGRLCPGIHETASTRRS